MKIKDYCTWTGQTCAKLDHIDDDNLHMVLGIITEAGELADVFKKYLAYKKEIDWVNTKEEIGDLMFYIGSFCRINNLDLEEILQINHDKLMSRYEDGFTEEKALNRNLEKERSILEQ